MLQDIVIKSNILPDFMIRYAIRVLLKGTLRKQESITKEKTYSIDNYLNILSKSQIAIDTDEANEQHYEVPISFFTKVLGPYLKYSCGLWGSTNDKLESSEKNMLELYIQRAQISNGQRILDMGCGWGSLSLFLAKRFPDCSIVCISNSKTQKEYIDKEINKFELTNLECITQDINKFKTEKKFDRIISIEMFEHIRNYVEIFSRIENMLSEKGLLFIHIFAHRKYAYYFDKYSESSWMARTFFSGGTMPSENLLPKAATNFELKNHWIVSGLHYQKTLEAWLKEMDNQKEIITNIFKATYGYEYKKMFIYWRIFFMACAETFGYNNGNEWRINHYLFQKK
ncbi:MAG: cyclopropane-fatty-acyl-phospholipid synthase family protein [Bacteroidales bacterium]